MPRKKTATILPLKTDSYRADIAKEQNILGRKIADARLRKNLTQSDLAKALGQYGIQVQAPAVTKWENGDAMPNPYILAAITKVLDVGDMLAFFGEQKTAPKDKLNGKGMLMLQQFREFLESDDRYTIKPRMAEMKRIPTSELPASAGTGFYLGDNSFTEMEFPSRSIPYGTEYAIRVTGNSMEPVYHDGQYVFVEETETLREGDVGIFAYQGEGYIKEYHETEPAPEDIEDFRDSYGIVHPQIWLVSYNKEYPPMKIINDFKIYGRVLN